MVYWLFAFMYWATGINYLEFLILMVDQELGITTCKLNLDDKRKKYSVIFSLYTLACVITIFAWAISDALDGDITHEK